MKAEGLAATLWVRPWARHLLPLHPLSTLSAYSLAEVQATGMGKRQKEMKGEKGGHTSGSHRRLGVPQFLPHQTWGGMPHYY